MKKTFFVLILVALANSSIFAQNLENNNMEKRFTFQTSPLLFMYDLISLGVGGEDTLFIMDLEGQYKINDIFNVSLTLSFLINNHTLTYYTYDYYPSYYTETSVYDEKTFQINFKPMFVYKPFRTGLAGFYIGLYPNLGWQSVKNEKYGDELWAEIGIGINTGYKWIFKNGFTLQLGTGIGKTWSIPEKPEGSFFMNSDGRITLENFDIHILDFKLGYSF